MREPAELHDYMGEERGRALGKPLNEFIDTLWTRLNSGKNDTEISIDTVAAVKEEELESLRNTRHRLASSLNDAILRGVEF